MTNLDKGTTVLVTGGAGFIGSHLVDALVVRGTRVRVLDNFSTGNLANLSHLADEIEIHEGDIRDEGACARACKGTDIVFHQAALGSVPRSIEDPASSYAVNVLGTVSLFEAAMGAGVARVVYASSSSVYGDSRELPKKEGREGRPLSPYAATKQAGEAAAHALGVSKGLESVGLRYFNVYGPRQDPNGPYAAVVPRFFDACSRGKGPTIFGDGEQSRDFTYVSDAVQANLLAASSPGAAGRVFNVARGEAVTVRELADRVLRLMDSHTNPILEPERIGDVKHSLADLTDARRYLHYEPSFDIGAGLSETARAYR